MFQFEPSAKQARQFDAAMHNALSESVLSLASQAESSLRSIDIEMVSNWHQSIGAGRRVSPAAFGAYYDLIDALTEDRFQIAEQLFAEVLFSDDFVASPRVRSLGHDVPEVAGDRFQRFMGNGKTDASGITAPRYGDVERFESLLSDAFGLLKRYRPTLYSEFDTLIRDIVLVAPDGSSDEPFEGGTSFKLWGALFLNAECRPSPAQLAVSLTHEEGHAALFGACRDEMLVENPDEERFWSPIRQAKRPMEGIFHATFVSARMVDLLLVLRRASILSNYERSQMDAELQDAIGIYEDGISIIKRHARLTETGRTVLHAMRHAMDQRLVAV